MSIPRLRAVFGQRLGDSIKIFKRKSSTSSPPPLPQPSKVERINSRLPRFLQRFTVPLRNAPVSHITAFVILHELTAIVPLFGLAATFHYTRWLPPYISEGQWVSAGIEKFGNYFRRKGWLGEESGSRDKWWGRGEGSVRIVSEFATAYAITKALLPLRLVLSVWATPWFARFTTIPLLSRFRKMFSRKSTSAPVAGTGATGARALPKDNPSPPL